MTRSHVFKNPNSQRLQPSLSRSRRSAKVNVALTRFPTSSHMFRNLIPLLAGDYRILAPDLPGYGLSDAPDHREFAYAFDHLRQIIAISSTRWASRMRRGIFSTTVRRWPPRCDAFPGQDTALIRLKVTRMSRASAKNGSRGSVIGGNRHLKIAKRAATSSSPQSRAIEYRHGATPRTRFHRTATCWILPIWDDPVWTSIARLILDYRSNAALFPPFSRILPHFSVAR